MTTYELRFRGDVYERGWRTLDTFASVEALKDSLDERASRGASPGALLHVVGKGLKGTTLFVADDGGGFVPAPKPPAGTTSWVMEWEGKQSDALWMLKRCKSVHRQTIVSAAVAIARLALPIWEDSYPGDSRPRRAIEIAAGAVASGDGGADDAAADAYDAAADAGSRTARGAAWAAALTAGAVAHDDPIPEAVAVAATVSSMNISQAALAAAVREHIPLGMVLLARIGG